MIKPCLPVNYDCAWRVISRVTACVTVEGSASDVIMCNCVCVCAIVCLWCALLVCSVTATVLVRVCALACVTATVLSMHGMCICAFEEQSATTRLFRNMFGGSIRRGTSVRKESVDVFKYDQHWTLIRPHTYQHARCSTTFL